MPGPHCLILPGDVAISRLHCLLPRDDGTISWLLDLANLQQEGYFGTTALAIPQRKLEWTSLGWKSFRRSVKLWKPRSRTTHRSRLPDPRNRNPVESPRRLTAGLTTESDPTHNHKNKNFGSSMGWSQHHGVLAVNSLPRTYTPTYIRPRKVNPIIIIIARAPHYSTTTIFNGICLV